MKKNYFKIMAAAMLMGMSFGLQSCDDVVGESDNPSGSTEEEVILPAGVTITANGARTLQIILSRSRSRLATKPAANS